LDGQPGDRSLRQHRDRLLVWRDAALRRTAVCREAGRRSPGRADAARNRARRRGGLAVDRPAHRRALGRLHDDGDRSVRRLHRVVRRGLSEETRVVVLVAHRRAPHAPVRPMSERLADAIATDDAAEVERVIEASPELKARLNDPLPGGSFGETALLAAVRRANREMVDVLLRAGADINQKSHWWAGPFHALDGSAREPWLPAFLIGRGAVPEIHHAVQLGLGEEVKRMLAEDPSLIHARGGDGQLPLHFAQTVGMAEYLVGRGADIDARDIDHESTAAQYMVRDRQPVARYLARRGAAADVL